MAVAGLKNRRAKEDEAKQAREERAKGNEVYFSLPFESDKPKVGDTVKCRIRPLQELDEDAKNYSAEAGVALFDKQWNNPSRDKWFKVISDTMADEGRCVGQEMSLKPTGGIIESGARAGKPETGWNKGWKPKELMYVNVLVDFLDGSEPVVKVAKFNMNPKAVQANVLIEAHDNYGSITDRWFAMTKTKDGTEDVNVAWKVTPLDKDDSLSPVTEYELVDLEPLLPYFPYAKQREALGLDEEEDTRTPELATASTGSVPNTVKW